MAKKEEVKTGKKHLFQRMLQEKKQLRFTKGGNGKYEIDVKANGKETALAEWVENQRRLFKQGKLSEEQVKRLEEAGLEWEHETGIWELRLRELTKYKEVHGDCMVPANWVPNPELGAWVFEQRKLHEKARLIPDRIRRLEELGFVFNYRKFVWDQMFNQLAKFSEEHGHANVPEHIEITQKNENATKETP
jgi:hypothetical protein